MASISSILPSIPFFRCFLLGCVYHLVFHIDVICESLECEINNARSLSHDCDDGSMKMVDPDSKADNCAIGNGQTTYGKTWKQVSKKLKSKAGLVLKTRNSTTRVYLTPTLNLTNDNGSPRSLYSEETTKLECHFEGRPLPRVVWHKDGKAVINGTKGFYHTEKLSEDYQDAVEATLFIPGLEENEGNYTCTANNSICHQSSKPQHQVFTVYYQCPLRIQATDSKIDTTVFSNTTLSCLIEDEHDFCGLKWLFNNSPLPSKSSDKYNETELKETSSRCKKVFSLTVMNVTNNDEGTYSCHQICKFTERWHKTSDNINLYVYAQPDTSTASPSSPSGKVPPRKWIFPVIISISACAIFALIIAVVVRYVMKKRAYKKIERLAEEGITNSNLFISYSSKDFTWVKENLIALLDKHSIPYSIHTRDFELGRPIVQNMADSVYNSRQVLIVLSDNYLASNFCREELHMAAQRAEDTGNSSVILVIINKFKKSRLPGVLRNKALLDFEKHKRKQDWEKKLLHAIFGAKTVSV